MSFVPVNLTQTSADPTTWGLRNAHDPTVVQTPNGSYVMYCTDAYSGGPAPAGVHMRTSTDLIRWEWAGTAFDGIPDDAHSWTGASGLWATEVVQWPTTDGTEKWVMYYSASTFGSRTSAIGIAYAPSATGPWEAGQLVVKTEHGVTTQNAIDAAISWDQAGTPWLTYGSFFSGLYTIALDPETGLPQEPGDLGVRVASRPRSVEGALEGAYIVNRSTAAAERHLMFVSFDSLINTYDVRVGHAPAVSGPYTDADDAPLISSELDGTALTEAPDQHGTLMLAGYQFEGQEALIAPGHNSVFTTADGTFMVHHVRYGKAPHQHDAQIRRMFWLESGWPVVSPMIYQGESAQFSQTLTDELHAGAWQVVDFRTEPEQLFVAEDRLAPCTVSQTLECTGDLREFGLEEAAVFNVVLPLASGPHTVLAFSGYARNNQANNRLTPVFGIKR